MQVKKRSVMTSRPAEVSAKIPVGALASALYEFASISSPSALALW